MTTQLFNYRRASISTTDSRTLPRPTMLCVICKSESYSQSDTGDYICDVCGTQSQDVFNEEVEYDEVQMARSHGRVITRKKRKIKKAKSDAGLPRSGGDLDVDMCLEAFQWVLNHHALTLVTSCGCQRVLHETVGRLWQHYLRVWAQTGFPIVNNFRRYKVAIKRPSRGKGAQQGGDDDYDGDGDDSDDAWRSNVGLPSSMPRLSIAMSLTLCYLACRQLREAVTSVDLIRWVSNDVLLYVDVFSHLPARLQQQLNPAKSFFEAAGTLHAIPTASALEKSLEALARTLDLPCPPLNAGLTVYRLVRGLGLPLEARAHAMELASRCAGTSHSQTSLAGAGGASDGGNGGGSEGAGGLVGAGQGAGQGGAMQGAITGDKKGRKRARTKSRQKPLQRVDLKLEEIMACVVVGMEQCNASSVSSLSWVSWVLDNLPRSEVEATARWVTGMAPPRTGSAAAGSAGAMAAAGSVSLGRNGRGIGAGRGGLGERGGMDGGSGGSVGSPLRGRRQETRESTADTLDQLGWRIDAPMPWTGNQLAVMPRAGLRKYIDIWKNQRRRHAGREDATESTPSNAKMSEFRGVTNMKDAAAAATTAASLGALAETIERIISKRQQLASSSSSNASRGHSLATPRRVGGGMGANAPARVDVAQHRATESFTVAGSTAADGASAISGASADGGNKGVGGNAGVVALAHRVLLTHCARFIGDPYSSVLPDVNTATFRRGKAARKPIQTRRDPLDSNNTMYQNSVPTRLHRMCQRAEFCLPLEDRLAHKLTRLGDDDR